MEAEEVDISEVTFNGGRKIVLIDLVKDESVLPKEQELIPEY